MLSCYQKSPSKKAIPISLLTKPEFNSWVKTQKSSTQAWLKQNNFHAEKNQYCLLMSPEGNISRVLVGLSENDMWAIADLSLKLPFSTYSLEVDLPEEQLTRLIIGWGLGAYQFVRYKTPKRKPAKLVISKDCDQGVIENIVSGIYLTRDLINTPTDDLGPSEFSALMFEFSQRFDAVFTEILGEALLDEGYPAVYTVGRGSDDAPRLLELTWGDEKDPKVTLVGKGVCFDSGGLNLKSAQNMLMMKKDMGGAAHVLGLAQMIMQSKLPIRLHVLIPVVENAISGSAYHPGDVITMRNGKTVEVTNTDAEGRLILADVLTKASEEKPDLIIDFATLTGAARAALGTEIVMMFSNDAAIAKGVLDCAAGEQDPLWQMPLYQPYHSMLESSIADMTNSSSEPYGGAITAALFLEAFVDRKVPWIHFDIMAMNLKSRPGRPEGGEAQMLRGMFAICQSMSFEKG